MKEKKFLEAFGQIEDIWIEEAISFKKPVRVYRTVKWAAAFLFLCSVSFSVCFQVSAEFRQWVISLFRIQEVEQVPDADEGKTLEKQDGIRLFAEQKIENLFDVEYLELDNIGIVSEGGDLFSSTIGTYEQSKDAYQYKTIFYKRSGKIFEEVPSEAGEATVSLGGITAAVPCDWCNYEGRCYASGSATLQVEREGKQDEVKLYIKGSDRPNLLSVTMYMNPEVSNWTWNYSAKYDLETGQMIDELADIQVKGRPIYEYPVLYDWIEAGNGRYYVTLGEAEGAADFYELNAETGEARLVREMTGLKELIDVKDCRELDFADGYLFLKCMKSQNTYDLYRYQVETGDCQQIYESVKKYAAADSKETKNGQGEDASIQIRELDQADGRYDLAAKDEKVYLVNKMTSTWKEIEGMGVEALSWTALPTTGSEPVSMLVLYNGFGNDREETEMGMIDLQEDVFYLWKRKRNPDFEEAGAWCQGSQIFLDAHVKGRGSQYLYIYTRKK